MAPHAPPTQRDISFRRPTADTLLVRLAGHWLLRDGLPTVDELQQQLDTPPQVRQLAFETQDMTAWDTGLLTFLRQVWDFSKQHQLIVDQTGLPEGVQRLLALATAVPEREGTGRGSRRLSWLAQIGANTLAAWQGTQGILEFIGAAVVTFLKFVVGRARFRRSDLALLLQECGAQALALSRSSVFLLA